LLQKTYIFENVLIL